MIKLIQGVLLSFLFLPFFFSPTLVQAEKLGPSKAEVSIFVTAWCPYCRKLETFLKDNGIKFKRYDIEKDRKGSLLYRQLGGGGIPLTLVDSTVVRGFDEIELRNIFQRLRRK